MSISLSGSVAVTGNLSFTGSAVSGGGTGSLSSGSSILIPSTLGSSPSVQGILLTITAGVAISVGNAVALNSNGICFPAIASSSSSLMPAIGVAYASISSGSSGNVLIEGVMQYNSWSFSTGSLLYVSDATSGSLTTTEPSASGDTIQIVGIVLNSTTILFMPNLGTITHS